VASNAQFGSALREINGFGEGRAIGHQGGRSDDSAQMRFNDGAIHTRGVTKIISVDDEPPHAASLAGQAGDIFTNELFV
jgi:hypothetical protein